MSVKISTNSISLQSCTLIGTNPKILFNKINYCKSVQFPGISHAEELHLIFRHESSVPFLTGRDIDFGNELITRWINFAYTG